MTKADEAVALYSQGFNCTQALLSVYALDYGLDRDAALRLARGLARAFPVRTTSAGKSRVR